MPVRMVVASLALSVLLTRKCNHSPNKANQLGHIKARRSAMRLYVPVICIRLVRL